MPSFDIFDIESVKNTDDFLGQRQVGVVHSVECSLVLCWRRIFAAVSTEIPVG